MLKIFASRTPEAHLGPEYPTVARTIHDVIRHWATITPDAPAIAAPNRREMSYRELMAVMNCMAHQLTQLGFGPASRLAVVHRGGAELMTTLLGIVNCAIAVPLNDEMPATELARHVEACRIDGVIADCGLDTPLRDIAQARGLRVIDVRDGLDGDPAGHAALDLTPVGDSRFHPNPSPNDVALMLRTSGTTRTPKLVPLLHRHIVFRAESLADLHELTTDDRCWNQNRLFLASGIANTCAPLYAGGCVIYPDPERRLDLGAFFEGLRTLRPTWYAASFNFNVGVFNALEADGSLIVGHKLRFIRATSGHLDQRIGAGLEEIFAVPVIEAYGSTEAGRICGNRLPPHRRKRGTVGLPTLYSEVAIVDECGDPCDRGERGEVVVRGANVFDGYADNPVANAAAFFGEWFRTGDEGYFDQDGYLTLVGRVTEMINRGGQKIAPIEIDEALLAHPSIAEAAACGLRHPTLGEIVAAVVVLRSEDAQTTAGEIHAFVRDRLAPFKWPRRLAFVEQIPRGPSGKVLRHEVARLFEDPRSMESTALGELHDLRDEVATPTEIVLTALWKSLLPATCFDVDDDFFMAGGDSLGATRLVMYVKELFEVELSLEAMLRGSNSIRAMAAKIDELKAVRSPDAI